MIGADYIGGLDAISSAAARTEFPGAGAPEYDSAFDRFLDEHGWTAVKIAAGVLLVWWIFLPPKPRKVDWGAFPDYEPKPKRSFKAIGASPRVVDSATRVLKARRYDVLQGRIAMLREREAERKARRRRAALGYARLPPHQAEVR